MNILLITPMLKEFHCAREVFSAGEVSFDKDFRLACKSTKKYQIYLFHCGFHLQKALDVFREKILNPQIIIDSGSCGALNSNFDLKQIFQINKVLKKGCEPLYYVDVPAVSDNPPVSLIEVNDPLYGGSERMILEELAELVSMESYSVCRYARENGIESYSFRVVTDYADSSARSDFKKNIRPAALLLYRYIYEFLNDLSH